MYNFLVFLVRSFVKLWFKVEVIGKENVPDKGGYIVASNHQSYWDPVLIAVFLKGKYCFMAKKELFRNKFFGWFITKLGAFPVERGSGDSAPLEEAVSRIKSGKIFVIFPEGTRSLNGKLGRGRSGVSVIAGMSGADLLPYAIKYDGRPKFRSKVSIRIGKLIPAEEIKISDTDRHQIKNTTNRIMGEIAALLEDNNDNSR